MPNSLQFPAHQMGLSLLEVLVATLVLSVGLLGLAGLQIAGMKTTHNSYQMQQATWLVYELLERMRANKPEVFRMTTAGANPEPDSNYLVSSSSADYCNAYHAPEPDCQNTSCTGQQMALADVYHILCGYGASSGVANVLMDGRLNVTCPTGDCRDRVNIDLQWNERNAARNTSDFDGGTDGADAFNINLRAVL